MDTIRVMVMAARILVPMSAALLAGSVCAAPLHDQDNGGIPAVVHLPDSTEGADLARPGKLRFALTANTASHSIDATRGDEYLVLDGETTQLELNLRYGVGSRLELGIELPYVWHKSGFLDSVIDTWHDLFGLSGGDRDRLPKDELNMSYQDMMGNRFDLRQNGNGVGDIRLTAGWRMQESATTATALRFALSLPTGDGNDLLGSGARAVSLGIVGDKAGLKADERLSGFYRFHVTHVGEPDFLADRYREFIGQFSVGIGYAATPVIDLWLQTAGRSALYDSSIEMLGEPSLTLTAGGNIRLNDQCQLSLSVTEDIKLESAPDVVFSISLRYRPDF